MVCLLCGEPLLSGFLVFRFFHLTLYTPWGYSGFMKQDIKKKAIRRLKIVEGQIRGLQRMVQEEKYCIDIINQSSAAKEALSGVEDLMLENHLSTHVVEQMKSGQHAKATHEVMSVYKLSKKRTHHHEK